MDQIKNNPKKTWVTPELLTLESDKTLSGSFSIAANEGGHTGPTTTFAS